MAQHRRVLTLSTRRPISSLKTGAHFISEGSLLFCVMRSNYPCVTLLYLALTSRTALSPMHMTKKSKSAGAKPSDGVQLPKTTRPQAAQFFNQLHSHSQLTCIPPPSNVTTAHDSAGAKRLALATDDDDIAMFVAECAALEAGKVHGPPSSLRQSSATPTSPDISPGDDDHFAHALVPASIPHHFQGLPGDDKRLRCRRSVNPSSDPAADDVSAEPVSRHASTTFLLAPPTPTVASHCQFSMGTSQVPPALTLTMPSRFVGAGPPSLYTRPER